MHAGGSRLTDPGAACFTALTALGITVTAAALWLGRRYLAVYQVPWALGVFICSARD